MPEVYSPSRFPHPFRLFFSQATAAQLARIGGSTVTEAVEADLRRLDPFVLYVLREHRWRFDRDQIEALEWYACHDSVPYCPGAVGAWAGDPARRRPITYGRAALAHPPANQRASIRPVLVHP